MDNLWAQLLLVAALILLNAAFAGTEIALISLREGKLARLADRGRTGRTLARLARDPNQFLATIQIGITLANLMASATAAVTLSEPLVKAFAALGAAARPTAVVVVTLVLTFLTLVFGELAPKRIVPRAGA
jgi:putative hemolysin